MPLKRRILSTAAVSIITIAGCSQVTDPKEALGYTPPVREVSAARQEAKSKSSEVLTLLHLNGKVTEPGPRISICSGLDPDKYFMTRHPWSLYGVPVEDMQQAMGRLKEQLPQKGWEITSYGTNSSRAKSLELKAESLKDKFALQVTLQDRRGRSEKPSMIEVTLVSSCYEVPEGQRVDEY